MATTGNDRWQMPSDRQGKLKMWRKFCITPVCKENSTVIGKQELDVIQVLKRVSQYSIPIWSFIVNPTACDLEKLRMSYHKNVLRNDRKTDRGKTVYIPSLRAGIS